MNLKRLRSIVFSVAFLVYGFCAIPDLLSQSPDPQCPVKRPSDDSGPEWHNLLNRWQQLTAVDLKSQVDTVSPTVRAQRNAYWQPFLERQYKAYCSPEGYPQGFGGVIDETRPELSYADGSVWVIATFESFQVFALDLEYHLLYTEMHFRINNVVRAPEELHLVAGTLIVSGIAGGKVKTPAGNIVSSPPPAAPEWNSFEPGHTYLLNLRPKGPEELFQVVKQWELSSGRVQPNDLEETSRAARGASAIDGMSESDLIDYLQKTLPPEPKQ